ncbi:MAG: SLC13/DASS family transporter [Clostridiales bacterium]|nr:SLC13/DASS family transporter [Clostridiales bacterium]
MDQSTIAIIIVVLAVISFALEKIPVALTAIVAALAMAMFGIIDLSKAYSDFGATATVMCAAMMIVGNACFDNGVAQAVGNGLKKIGLDKNERVMIGVICAASALLSAFLSNSAVTAMFIPLVASIVAKSNGRVKNKNVLLAVGVGAGIGGVCTLSGSTPQIAAQGILEITEGVQTMGYFTLAKAGAPLCVIAVIYFMTLGYSIEKKVLKFDDVIPVATDGIHENSVFDKKKQRITAIVILLCLVGFVSGIWNIAVVAMTGATLLLLTKCVTIKKAFHDIDWNTILVLACSQGFAAGIDKSGAGAKIANGIIGLLGANATPFAVLALVIVVTVILTNFMSNISTAVMMIPIAINLAQTLNSNVLTFVIAIVIASQCAFATPIGTACMTQVMVGGYKYMDYVKVGVPITIILTIASIFLIPLCYGL